MRKTELLRLAVMSLAVATTSLVRAQVIDPNKTGGPPAYKFVPAKAAAAKRSYSGSLEPPTSSSKTRS